MHLCRFVRHDDPQTPRTGIYHDGKFYETDGAQAVGVHEAADSRLLTPVRLPALCRLAVGSDEVWSYTFADPAAFASTGEPLDAGTGGVALELRVAAVCAGTAEEPGSGSQVLGYVPIVGMVSQDLETSLAGQGLPTTPSRSGGAWLGPFLVTSEDLDECARPGEADRFELAAVATMDEWESRVEDVAPVAFGPLLHTLGESGRLRQGELVAGPPSLVSPPGGFEPGDRCRIDFGPLGVVVAVVG